MHVSSTARRYGRSLARVAIDNRVEKTVGAQLQGVWEYLRDTPSARLLLESPASSLSRQLELVDQAASVADLSPYVANFMRVLAEERRYTLFREVVEAYRQEIDRYHGVVEAEVITAHPLDDEQREAVRGALQRSVAEGSEVRLDLKVDPTLIAGAVTKIGSVVHDGSLSHQLDVVRKQLTSE